MGNAYPGLVVGGVSAAPKELVKQAANWHDAMGAGKTFRQKTNDRRKGLKLVCTRQHKHRTLKCAALLVAKWRAADPEARGGERLRRHLETTKVVGRTLVRRSSAKAMSGPQECQDNGAARRRSPRSPG